MPGPKIPGIKGPEFDPLAGTPGVKSDHDPNHPMPAALRDLVRAQRLRGAVLLSIDSAGDNIGINSSSPDPRLGAAMTRLGDMILAAFQRGDFDAALDEQR